jgi:hypothetical protein
MAYRPHSITEAFELAQLELNKTLDIVQNYNKLSNKKSDSVYKSMYQAQAFQHLINYWRYTGIGQEMLQKGRDNLILPISKL